MPRTDSNVFVSREPVPLEPPKDLRDYVAPIRLHKWLVVGFAIVGLVGGWMFGARTAPSYTSEVQILIGPGVVDPTAPASTDPNASISMSTEADIAASRAVGRLARETLATEEPLDDILDRVTTQFALGSSVLTLDYTDESPELARDGAAAFAQAYLDFRSAPLQASLDERSSSLNDELDALQTEFDDLTAQLEDDTLTPGQILKIQADSALVSSDLELVRADVGRVDSLTVDAGTIVAGATVPTESSSGGRLTKFLYAAVGLILGTMIGLVAAYVREIASDSLHGVGDLEELLDAPVLGLVHKAKGRGKGPFVVGSEGDGTLLQDVRAIRSTLLNAAGPESRRYLVTSSTQRDGRTTLAASLASVIASGDMRVILVSADMNAPALERMFGVQPAHDLVDVLEGRASLDEALIPTTEVGLSLVASRPLAAQARGDLVESEAMGAFLKAAGERADVVILDSPPLVVADPLALASQVDGVIYVADARHAKRRRVARAGAAIEQAGGVIVGSVLNRFVPRRVRVGASQFRSEERQRRRYLSSNGSGTTTPQSVPEGATTES